MSLLLPPGWTPPIGYANGVVVPAGRIVFVAGQVGWDEQQRFHATMTSTLLCKTSEMRPGSCANEPFGQRTSMDRFFPSVQPRCWSASRKALSIAGSGDTAPITATRQTLPVCCACAVSGHAAAPLRSVMNSRRFTARCLPCFDRKIAHFGTAGDLPRCGISVCPMSVAGHSRRIDTCPTVACPLHLQERPNVGTAAK